jgi:hypothetical protein
VSGFSRTSGSSKYSFDPIESLGNSVVMLQVVQVPASRFDAMKNELGPFAFGEYHVLCVLDDDAISGRRVVKDPSTRLIAGVP